MTLKSKDGHPDNPRSTQDVLSDHLRKRKDHQVEDDIALNYAQDVVLFTSSGIMHGHDGVREAVGLLHDQLPRPVYTYTTLLVEGELAFLEWTGISEPARVCDGADSYVIRNGRIIAQTIHYTIEEIIDD